MWPHRPVGRGLITLAIALLGATTLLLDAAAPGAGHGASLVAWHAVSTLTLLGLGLWALWSPALPAAASRALSGLAGLLLGAFTVAAQRLPAGELDTRSAAMGATLLLATALYAVGWRWARSEIRW